MKTTYDRLLERGREEGRAEGRAKGHAEGRAAILIKLLEARFRPLPAGVTERVCTASIEQLDRWAIAVLGARTLEEAIAPS